MNALERRAARIMVAMSATADARIELEIYRYLLGDAPPEIVGLVVEDPALLAHAGSGLAREIVLSGFERRLDPQALERQLRARAAEWRRMLEAERARLGMRIALETVREERRAALAAEHADALIVESAAVREALEIWRALPPGAPLRTLVVTPERRPSGDIVVVIDEAEPHDDPNSALAASVRLARRTGARLAVLDIAAGEAAPDARVRQLAALGVRVGSYASLPEGRIDPLALAAYAAQASLLVLPAAASRDPDLVEALAARIRGALMLLRGARPGDERDDT